MPKYFGDKMTLPMQEYLKEMVANLEKHNDWFKFNKPPHEISCISGIVFSPVKIQ